MQTGRPSTLDNTVRDQIVAAIQRGAYVETAVAMAGVSKQSFYNWMKRGRHVLNMMAEAHENEQPDISTHDANCANFVDAIERAQAQSELRDLQAIDQAAQNGQWQAAAWKLERKHHARWGRKVAVTDEQGGNFFDGMARAWATALENETDHDAPKRIENANGSGDHR